MASRRSASNQLRPTLFDTLTQSQKNIYCQLDDLSNEASVETFFVSRLLKDLGFQDSQIKTKKSLESLIVAHGHRREKYKPDYALTVKRLPRCIVDAKAVDENLDDWTEQCSGYCLALNRRFQKSNPVKYFVLSNGKSTKLYKWDQDEPLLMLDFSDFETGNPKYEQLKKIIGAQTIIEEKPEIGEERVEFAFVHATSERARQLFALCHRAIWKSEVCGHAAAFMEFIKIMFVKLWEDRNLRENESTRSYFQNGLTTVRLPRSAVKFSVQWIEKCEKDGVTNPLDSILFEQLRENIERAIQFKKKKRIFEAGERIKLKPDTVKNVVKRLEHYDLFGIDEDLNGRLFETFLSATMRGRELGQFFTPRSVVQMMTRIAGLEVTRTHQSKVIDACCGSGGFLIEALTVMRNLVRENVSLSEHEKEVLLGTICDKCLYGIDLGKDPPLARIARMNMYLHGDGGSRIYYADALDKDLKPTKDEDAELLDNRTELKTALANTLFDIALTNPPFSMTKEAGNETEYAILSRYDLAKRDATSSAIRPSLRSSLMFIERYWDLLELGGKLVTVIDDTLLASEVPVFKKARGFIRERFLIRAIISLPGDTFRRSGSRVKTSVLILEKKENESDKQPGCFGFFSHYLGVDDLTPRASESDVQEARARAKQEIDEIASGYEAYLSGKSGPLVVPAQRLVDRLDLKHCAGEFGRMAENWRKRGVEVRQLDKIVTPIEDVVIPSLLPDEEFTLIKVSYDGRCELEKIKKGRKIKAKKMYKVKTGQIVFSTIRATDGAIGIVPEAFDGALVSGSYTIFDALKTPEDTAYLWAVLRSHEIRADMQSQSPGSGRYTTYWPQIGSLLIPWLPESKRKTVGERLIRSWELERQTLLEREAAMKEIEDLGVESEESKKRFKASKAPT